jgi:cytochrome c-type protein NapC
VKKLLELWRWLWRPSARWSLGTLVGGGAVFGILFWGAFNWTLEATNTEAFCISCHEMRSTVYEELKETIHFANRSGVRATCPDCHVPRNWTEKLERKMAATINELPKHLLGTMNTKEKFEEKRYELAFRVWTRLKENDSLPCRNCHDYVSIGTSAASAKA